MNHLHSSTSVGIATIQSIDPIEIKFQSHEYIHNKNASILLSPYVSKLKFHAKWKSKNAKTDEKDFLGTFEIEFEIKISLVTLKINICIPGIPPLWFNSHKWKQTVEYDLEMKIDTLKRNDEVFVLYTKLKNYFYILYKCKTLRETYKSDIPPKIHICYFENKKLFLGAKKSISLDDKYVYLPKLYKDVSAEFKIPHEEKGSVQEDYYFGNGFEDTVQLPNENGYFSYHSHKIDTSFDIYVTFEKSIPKSGFAIVASEPNHGHAIIEFIQLKKTYKSKRDVRYLPASLLCGKVESTEPLQVQIDTLSSKLDNQENVGYILPIILPNASVSFKFQTEECDPSEPVSNCLVGMVRINGMPPVISVKHQHRHTIQFKKEQFECVSEIKIKNGDNVLLVRPESNDLYYILDKIK